MTELIVTGCVIAPCRNEPEWLIPAVLNAGGAIQLDTLIQVCKDHLAAFGYDPNRTDDVGYPARFTYFSTGANDDNGAHAYSPTQAHACSRRPAVVT